MRLTQSKVLLLIFRQEEGNEQIIKKKRKRETGKKLGDGCSSANAERRGVVIT